MISEYLIRMKEQIEAALYGCLPPPSTRPTILHEAMHYCVLNGGKRIRPILCVATAEVYGIPSEQSLLPSISIELYHCSTLVHDDLPSMDNDALRRGAPTCHIKFGEANAILTGDALLTHAFLVLAQHGTPQLSVELAQAAGSLGVIAGQVEDLAAEGRPPNADLIEFIHTKKTAILIRAAVRMGAMLGDADSSDLENLTTFGEKIGLAFQIQDDILDEISSDEILGKPSGSDQAQQKMTYPAVYGIETAKATVAKLTTEALASLDHLPRNTEVLRRIANDLVSRKC